MMRILAIETSADETSSAVIENGTKILSNVVASSKDFHDKTGGIIPEVAAREQVRCIIPVISEAMRQCNNITMDNLDAVAVTVGPGLNGSLLIGVETAKTIAFVTGKPVIPVNHIFAHLYANWLFPQLPTTNYHLPAFPVIALVVSGGHTELLLMKSHKDIGWLGGTLDDAAGEVFDKTARLLGLGYPGGPAIADCASKPTTHNPQPITKLPRPMINSKDFNFSFSGLKTAVLREVNKLKILKQFNNLTIQQLAHEIQESITDVLVTKTLKAAWQYNVKSIILGGGVAANQRLKEKFISFLNPQHFDSTRCKPTTNKPQLFIPPPDLCTDNAAYIGSFAYFHYQPKPWQEINTKPDLNIEV